MYLSADLSIFLYTWVYECVQIQLPNIFSKIKASLNDTHRTNRTRLFTFYEKHCGHVNCIKEQCTFKKRMTTYHLIVGLVLPFWEVFSPSTAACFCALH